MKTLYLLRHAEAAPGPEDFARPLTAQGRAQAEGVGQWFADKDIRPDMALCSTARRTHETLNALREAVQGITVRAENALYNAAPETMYALITGFDNRHESAVVIAHNPGIHLLCVMLAATTEITLETAMLQGFGPATMAIIECPIDDWAKLAPHANRLLELVPAV